MKSTRVKDRSNYTVVKIPSTEPVKVVAELILVKSIGSVIVVEDDTPVGIVTERDLIRAFYKDDSISISDPISKLMSSPLCTIREDELLYVAVQKMIMKGYRQLGVVDNNNKLVATCSINDLMIDLSNARHLLTEAQCNLDREGNKDTAAKLSHEIDHLLVELDGYTDHQLENNNLPYHELQRLLSRLKKLAKKNIEVRREEPKLFLLMNSNGLNLFSRKITDSAANGQLMSGFFFAVNEWMKEIVVEKGFIDRIKYQDYTIAIKSINSYLFCYMFKGDSYSGFNTLERIAELILADKKLSSYLESHTKSITKVEEAYFNKVIDQVLGFSMERSKQPVIYSNQS